MNLRPLANRVIVKPDAAPTRTDSGLHLVEHYKPEQMGTVVSVGHTRCTQCDGTRDAVVRPGDTVLFSWQVGQELFDHDTNERYLILLESDLLAVIDG